VKFSVLVKYDFQVFCFCQGQFEGCVGTWIFDPLLRCFGIKTTEERNRDGGFGVEKRLIEAAGSGENFCPFGSWDGGDHVVEERGSFQEDEILLRIEG